MVSVVRAGPARRAGRPTASEEIARAKGVPPFFAGVPRDAPGAADDAAGAYGRRDQARGGLPSAPSALLLVLYLRTRVTAFILYATLTAGYALRPSAPV